MEAVESSLPAEGIKEDKPPRLEEIQAAINTTRGLINAGLGASKEPEEPFTAASFEEAVNQVPARGPKRFVQKAWLATARRKELLINLITQTRPNPTWANAKDVISSQDWNASGSENPQLDQKINSAIKKIWSNSPR